MAADTIIQRVIIQGGKEVEAALNSIGAAGEKAFNKISASAERSARNLEGKMQAVSAKRLADEFRRVNEEADRASGGTSRFARVLDFLGATSREANNNARQFGRTARDTANGMGRLADSSDQASGRVGAFGEALGTADIATIRLGQSLRLIGRSAGLQGLSQLGRGLGTLGRAFQLASPVILVAGLGKLADAAARSAEQIGDLAAKNLVSARSFQEINSAFAGVGLGVDATAKSFDGLSRMISQAADNTSRNAQNTRRMNNELEDSRARAGDLAKEFTNIQRTATNAFQDIARQRRNLLEQQHDLENGEPNEEEKRRRRQRDISEQLQRLLREEQEARRKQEEDTRKLIEAQAKEARQIRETQQAMREAREEAERNATALERLGIRATDANGRLRTVPGVLEEIAQKLSGVTNADQRTRIEQELIAAGLERRLLPALRQGVEGFRALQREGERIRPPFNEAQLRQADEFVIAVDRLKQAFLSIVDAAGLAIGPNLKGALDSITEAFIAARPVIADFAAALSGILGPVLEGVVNAFRLFGRSLMAVLDDVAGALNRLFGTNLNGADVLAGIVVGLIALFARLPAIIIGVVAALGQLDKKLKELGFGGITKEVIGFVIALGGILLIASPIARLVTGILGIGRALITAGAAVARFVGSFGSLISIVARVVSGVVGFGAAIGGLPAILAIAIAAAVGFFAVWAFKNWDKITKFASDTFKSVMDGAANLWERVKQFFNDGVQAVANFFTQTIPQKAQEAWDFVVKGAQDLWTSITQLFSDGIAAVAAFFTETLPNAAQQVWDLVVAGATSLWETVKQLFNDGVTAIVNFFTVTIPEAGRQAWEGIKQGAVTLWDNIKAVFTAGVDAVVKFFTETIPQKAQEGWDFIKTAAGKMWDGITGFFQSGYDKVVEILGRIRDFAVGVWDRIRGAARDAAQAQSSASSEAGSAADGFASAFARGGPVRGPGSGTSDSIPAWLSAGEFVHTARAVRHYGVAFMQAINQLKIPRELIRGFKLGGLVDRLQVVMPPMAPLKFADGGPVPGGGSSLHPVTIDLGNGQRITGLQAPADIVRNLQRAAAARSVASAGVKPTYYGRGR